MIRLSRFVVLVTLFGFVFNNYPQSLGHELHRDRADNQVEVSSQSTYRIHGTLDKLEKITQQLEAALKQNQSRGENLIRVQQELTGIRATLEKTKSFMVSCGTMTVSAAHFIFSIKGLLMLAVLGVLTKSIFGTDALIIQPIMALSETFSTYLAYLVGNLCKHIVIGLKDPIQECLNNPACTQELKGMIADITSLIGQGAATGAAGVTQGVLDFAWNHPGQAMVAAASTAAYSAFTIMKLVVPAYIAARFR